MRAIAEGWVTGIHDVEKQVQPNAIDFTIDKAWTINSKYFYISETHKIMRGSSELKTQTCYYEGQENPIAAWILHGSSILDMLSDMYVKIPEGVAARLVIRSTLARNALTLHSGLYDSGFEGHIGCVIHNHTTYSACLAVGTRVGQIIFEAAETAKMYNGQYKHEEGTDLEYQDET